MYKELDQHTIHGILLPSSTLDNDRIFLTSIYRCACILWIRDLQRWGLEKHLTSFHCDTLPLVVARGLKNWHLLRFWSSIMKNIINLCKHVLQNTIFFAVESSSGYSLSLRYNISLAATNFHSTSCLSEKILTRHLWLCMRTPLEAALTWQANQQHMRA